MKTLWIVCGPTASGKTALAIELAQRLSAEILSADSRQLYSALNIGVARPDPEELAAVPHHFIANTDIREEYSAGRFGREARIFALEYFREKDHLVVCGGTGLYIRAMLEGIDRAAADPALRESLQIRLEKEGPEALAVELQMADPELAANTDLHNPRRIIRALEWHLSGSPALSVPGIPDDWKIMKMAPEQSREELYSRINLRVDRMMEQGLWEEAEALFPMRHLNALHTVGYREIFDCMEGKCSRTEAIEKIKQHSRNYAKRQLTWFRKDPDIVWIKSLRDSRIPPEWGL